MAFSSVPFSAISAMLSTEGKESCLLEFRLLSSDVETVLGELHVLQCLDWYFQMTRLSSRLYLFFAIYMVQNRLRTTVDQKMDEHPHIS
jgi:hypothetical protein